MITAVYKSGAVELSLHIGVASGDLYAMHVGGHDEVIMHTKYGHFDLKYIFLSSFSAGLNGIGMGILCGGQAFCRHRKCLDPQSDGTGRLSFSLY